MRYTPILLIVAVLAFGAAISRATEPDFVICGTTQIPVAPVGYVAHLTLDVDGNITHVEIRSAADLDGDDDVDLDDYAIFQASFTGPLGD